MVSRKTGAARRLRRAVRKAAIEFLERRTLLAAHAAHIRLDPKLPKEPTRGVNAQAPRLPAEPTIDLSAPPVLGTIEAVNFDTAAATSGFYRIPPDANGAVGPNHVVNTVNSTIQWFLKTGGAAQNTQRLGKNASTATGSFFASLTPVNGLLEPKVIYDQYNGRFVVAALEMTGSTSRILLAVSDDADPNGTWYFHSINSKTSIFNGTTNIDCWTDSPGLAVDANAIYITGNEFAFSGTPFPASGGGSSAFGGTRLFIVSKSGLYTGGVPTSLNVFDAATSAGIGGTNGAFALMPTQMFGAAPGTTGTFLLSSGWVSGATDFLSVIRVQNPLAGPTFSNTFVNLGDIHNTTVAFPSGAPQSGTATQVHTGDSRVLGAVWRNNEIWATNTVNPPSGTDAGTATAHWYKIFGDSTTIGVGGAHTPDDQGNVGGEDIAAGTRTMWSSIMVDSSDNMALGFAASGPGIFPGAYYTGRLAGDAAGTVQSSVALAAGQDFYVRTFPAQGGTVNRWGDYSAVALDPSDSSTFWVYNEYALPRGTLLDGEDGRWGTRWGRFTFATGPGSITGLVYEDRNGNGSFDGTDVGMGALTSPVPVTVFLDNNNDGKLDGGEPSTVTSGAGNYTFSGLVAGNYHLRQVVPSGYVPVNPANGAVDIPVAGATVTQNIGDFPIVYNGLPSADSYLLRMSGTKIEILVGGVLTYTAPQSLIPVDASLTFNLNGGNDTMTVESTDVETIIHGGSEDDTINIGAIGGGDLGNMTAAITVTGDGGSDSVTLNDNATFSGADPYTIDSTTVTRPFFGNGLGLTYSSIETLTLNAQPEENLITLNGTAAETAVIVNGNGGGDTMTIAVASSSPVTFNGGNSGTLNVNAGAYTFNADAHLGTSNLVLNVNNAGSAVTFNATQHLASLAIANGTATLTANGSRVINTGTLSITSGKLDLKDNDMVVRNGTLGSVTGSTYNGVTGLVQSGRNGGPWNGNGIVTSSASGNFTTLGVATAQQARNLASPTDTAVFSSETVTGNAILVKFTYGGDSNLDGKINIDDYGHIDSSIGIGLTGWFNGDFNYDGKDNVDDYGIIDFNIGIQGPAL